MNGECNGRQIKKLMKHTNEHETKHSSARINKIGLHNCICYEIKCVLELESEKRIK